MHPLPKLPPRCRMHKYQRGCPDCQIYNRARLRRRARLRAYGLWQGNENTRIPAAQVGHHVRQAIANGSTIADMAAAAGVTQNPIYRLLREGPDVRVTAGLAARLLAVTGGDPYKTAGIGAARRLQALSCAGWRIIDLVDPTRITWAHLVRLRDHVRPVIMGATHRSIAAVYEDLWDTAGPSRQTAAHSKNRGWHPFEAWTDVTIDDPAAQPYSEADRHIDLVKVERAHRVDRSDRVLISDLSLAEQVAVYQAFAQRAAEAGRVVSMKRFRDAYRPVPANLARRLADELGLQGQEAAIK